MSSQVEVVRWTPFGKCQPTASGAYHTIAAHGVQQPLYWTGFDWAEWDGERSGPPVWYDVLFWRWVQT